MMMAVMTTKISLFMIPVRLEAKERRVRERAEYGGARETEKMYVWRQSQEWKEPHARKPESSGQAGL
jgi:hypothetical protein